MREIKFRVWDNERKEWVHGPGNEVNLFGECIICGEFLRRDSDDTHVKLDDLNDMVALQFCGLKDKNGKEIYEGDIVRYEMPGPPPEDLMIEYIEPITFSVASFDVEGAPLYVVNEVCEVIGNIYENPELLK